MASQKQQYTILYGRLSQEDERAGESNSIQHQRDLLEKYARDKGFENTLFLADDGYSGTNFERPSWKKIVEMIEAGEVSTLIVKDASRLGREYLQVGYYMEIYFPQKNVRFIAVNDGVDSAVESSNDFNPIRNWANELHAKDTSRKVRAVKKLQAERGEWLGGRPPYGYRKSETAENYLEPDPEAAEIVRQIFSLCAAGKGPSQIARILADQNVLTPANYYFQKTGKTHEGRDVLRPCAWSETTVSDILGNIVYLGHTVGLRRTTISYKNKTIVQRPESEQFLVENIHPPLISQEQWQIVQEVRQGGRMVHLRDVYDQFRAVLLDDVPGDVREKPPVGVLPTARFAAGGKRDTRAVAGSDDGPDERFSGTCQHPGERGRFFINFVCVPAG